MRHLNLETLARLVDEPPAADEAQHLENCELCQRELHDLRADLAHLAELPPIEPPSRAWPLLEARLANEGLVRSAARQGWRNGLIRAAAAVAIFLLGGFSGAAWTGGEADVSETEAGTVPADRSLVLQALESGRVPESPEQLVLYANEAEALYFDATRRVAALEMSPNAGDPYVTLTAIEGILRITGTALEQEPADVVLNGYHMTALAQRDAILRRVAVAGNGRWF